VFVWFERVDRADVLLRILSTNNTSVSPVIGGVESRFNTDSYTMAFLHQANEKGFAVISATVPGAIRSAC
jgi:hypothetical protein